MNLSLKLHANGMGPIPTGDYQGREERAATTIWEGKKKDAVTP